MFGGGGRVYDEDNDVVGRANANQMRAEATLIEKTKMEAESRGGLLRLESVHLII